MPYYTIDQLETYAMQVCEELVQKQLASDITIEQIKTYLDGMKKFGAVLLCNFNYDNKLCEERANELALKYTSYRAQTFKLAFDIKDHETALFANIGSENQILQQIRDDLLFLIDRYAMRFIEFDETRSLRKLFTICAAIAFSQPKDSRLFQKATHQLNCIMDAYAESVQFYNYMSNSFERATTTIDIQNTTPPSLTAIMLLAGCDV